MGKFSPVDHYFRLFQYYWLRYLEDRVAGLKAQKYTFAAAIKAKKRMAILIQDEGSFQR